jgi:hypothetical protein
MFGSNYLPHRQTNKFKILCAHSESGPRCSILKVSTLYEMCPPVAARAEGAVGPPLVFNNSFLRFQEKV